MNPALRGWRSFLPREHFSKAACSSAFDSAIRAPKPARYGGHPLLRNRPMRKIGNITAFFGADDVFSNWHSCQFVYHDVVFTSVEQFMMVRREVA
jgi:hypothetical protein